MTEVSVRPLEQRDLAEVWRIFCAGNLDIAVREPLLPAPGEGGYEAWADEVALELDDDEHLHLVVERSGACIGWGHAHVAFAPMDQQRFGYVSAVYVAPDARRLGAATALLKALTGWLDTQDVARIELVTPSRSEAREIWLRLGFRPLIETLVLEPKKR